jgi:Ca-activated chloride channel family protein
MVMTRASALIVLLCLAGWSWFETLEPNVERGNVAMEHGNFDGAIASYRKAVPLSQSERELIALNMGLAYAAKAEGRTLEATERAHGEEVFLLAAQSADGVTRSSAYLGLGVLRFREGAFEDSADAFRLALRANPRNLDARYNLELALRKLGRAGEPPGGGLPGAGPGRSLDSGKEPPDSTDVDKGEPDDKGAGALKPPGNGETGDPDSTGDANSDQQADESEVPEAADGKPGQAPESQGQQRRDDIQRKLEALERRSRELQRRRLRMRGQAGSDTVKDW